ncbi:MAG: CBS domain-containing protein [Candidatus Ancaeobacter aquaticus]|nr:CBS domain-containing protein [Candidatus Ancaeobacter aquaticus]
MIDKHKHFLYFTEMLDCEVIEQDTSVMIGRIVDLVASTKELYPRIVGALIMQKKTKKQMIIPWNKLEYVKNRMYLLKGEYQDLLKVYEPSEGEFLLKDEYLDMQIVDTYGANVVRVNDFHLLKEKDILWVVHADVGARGIMRRLGFEKIVDNITHWLFDYTLKERFISWKYVQSLDEPGKPSSVLKLKVTQQKLSGLWPADLAEIIEDLGMKERMNLFRALDTETAANVIKEVSPHVRKTVFEAIGKEKGTQIFKELPVDDIADIIVELPDRKAEVLLSTLDKEEVEKIREIAAVPKNEAGSFMELDYITLSADMTVQAALEKIRKAAQEIELINYIYITDDDNSLRGVTTLRRIMINEPDTKIGEFMHENVIRVKVDTNRKEVMRMFAKYDFDVLPVTDDENQLEGVIALKNSLEELVPQLARE